MRVPRYVEESEDLKQARQKEAQEHRDFLHVLAERENRFVWTEPVFAEMAKTPFSQLYDAEVAA